MLICFKCVYVDTCLSSQSAFIILLGVWRIFYHRIDQSSRISGWVNLKGQQHFGADIALTGAYLIFLYSVCIQFYCWKLLLWEININHLTKRWGSFIHLEYTDWILVFFWILLVDLLLVWDLADLFMVSGWLLTNVLLLFLLLSLPKAGGSTWWLWKSNNKHGRCLRTPALFAWKIAPLIVS